VSKPVINKNDHPENRNNELRAGKRGRSVAKPVFGLRSTRKPRNAESEAQPEFVAKMATESPT
jgi:hypothetical protein